MQQLTAALQGMLFNSVTVFKGRQGISAVMFDKQFRQGEWRGWRSSFARKFGVIACSSIQRFSSLLETSCVSAV
ncbi:hypothetical protein [Rhizobium leguminosarum]|uniref:hypothetical protein n=1 Tax=Rhizobium leguminosarum TaxID=384 RepID=UPI001C981E32|nr:hypothetical protein [Rhizobium leguminosarum]MBY5700207.1 hypothetical protein [Rhizobium leguminosarum]